MKLSNWYTHYRGPHSNQSNVTQPDEQQRVCVAVSGDIIDDNGVEVGKYFTTGQPQFFYEDDGKFFVSTYSGAVYELGDPLMDSEKINPNTSRYSSITFGLFKQNQKCLQLNH